METLFRTTIIASTILFAAYWLFPSFDYYWLTDEELQLLSASGFNAIIQYHPVIYWGMLAIGLLLNLGLFFYVKLAKDLLLPVLVAFSALGLFWGFQVITPYEGLVGGILNTIDGALIIMVYFTSVSNRFSESDS